MSLDRHLRRLLSDDARSIHALRMITRALGLDDADLDAALARIGAFRVWARTGHKLYALPDSEKVDPRPRLTPIRCGHTEMWRSADGPWRCDLCRPPAIPALVHRRASITPPPVQQYRVQSGRSLRGVG